jgi:hypothetical protein
MIQKTFAASYNGKGYNKLYQRQSDSILKE